MAVEVFVFTTEDVTCVNFARRIENTRGLRTTTKRVGTSTKKSGPEKIKGMTCKLKYLKWKDVSKTCFFFWRVELTCYEKKLKSTSLDP